MKTLLPFDELHYVKGIIKNNPDNHVFPITHKSNSGVSLDVWETALKELGISYKRQPYQHKVYSADGYSEYTAEQIIKVEGVSND